jgi:hypothetical protein
VNSTKPLLISCIGYVGGQWAFYGKLEQQAKQDAPVEAQTGAAAARNLWQNKTKLGQEKKGDSDVVKSQHENIITGLSIANTGSSVTKVSTTSFDGKLVIWQLSDLSLDLAALRL